MKILDRERKLNERILLMPLYSQQIGKDPFDWTKEDIIDFVSFCESQMKTVAFCNKCGKHYTQTEFEKLEFSGYMKKEDGWPQSLELRQCPCFGTKNTISAKWEG